jgi:biopolymer transport protein TolR
MQVGSGGAGEVKSDINVTPLVDVCLVLLIIFMVVTPMLQKGVHISLPPAAASEKKPDGANTLTVAIDAKKQIFIERDAVPKENFLSAMQELHDRSPEKTIYIKADKLLKYGDVKDIMMKCNQAGFDHVGLLTEPRAEAESKSVKK